MRKVNLTRDELYRLYWDEKLSQSEIAKKVGVHRHTILYCMKRLNIPKRSYSEANKLLMSKPEVRQKLREADKRYWTSEEGRKRASEFGKSFWNSLLPEEKLKYCERLSQRCWSRGLTKLTDSRLAEIGRKVSVANKGKKAWNRGLTKETSTIVQKYAETFKRKIHDKLLLHELEVLKEKGFRCIPLTRIRPDAIAIKDGKVYAVELEMGDPNYDKYTLTSSPYDDVIWIIQRRKNIG